MCSSVGLQSVVPAVEMAALIDAQAVGVARMAELTAAQLWQMIKRTPKAKAPGVDGWRYQDWPLPMVDMLAKFYALVEKAGR